MNLGEYNFAKKPFNYHFLKRVRLSMNVWIWKIRLQCLFPHLSLEKSRFYPKDAWKEPKFRSFFIKHWVYLIISSDTCRISSSSSLFQSTWISWYLESAWKMSSQLFQYLRKMDVYTVFSVTLPAQITSPKRAKMKPSP